MQRDLQHWLPYLLDYYVDVFLRLSPVVGLIQPQKVKAYFWTSFEEGSGYNLQSQSEPLFCAIDHCFTISEGLVNSHSSYYEKTLPLRTENYNDTHIIKDCKKLWLTSAKLKIKYSYPQPNANSIKIASIGQLNWSKIDINVNFMKCIYYLKRINFILKTWHHMLASRVIP